MINNKINVFKLTVLAVALVAGPEVRAAESTDKLLEQARQFAQQLAMFGNAAGQSLVHRLIGRIEHLMPLQTQVRSQAARIALLEAQTAQVDQRPTGISGAPVVQLSRAEPAPIIVTGRAVRLILPEPTSSSSSSSSSSSLGSQGLALNPAVSKLASEQAKPLFDRAKNAADLKLFNAALVELENILTIPGLSNEDRSRAFASIGDAYRCGDDWLPKNFEKALEYYQQALAIHELSPRIRAAALLSMGVLYASVNNKNRNLLKAKECYLEALAMKELPEGVRAQSHGLIGTVYTEIVQTSLANDEKTVNRKQAIEHYDLALSNSQLSRLDRARFLVNKACACACDRTKEGLSQALKCYQEALGMEELPQARRAVVQQYEDKARRALEKALEDQLISMLQPVPTQVDGHGPQVQIASSSSVRAETEDLTSLSDDDIQIISDSGQPVSRVGYSGSSSSSSSSSSSDQSVDDNIQTLDGPTSSDSMPRTSVKRTERTAISAVAQEDRSKRLRTQNSQGFFCEECSIFYKSQGYLNRHKNSKTHKAQVWARQQQAESAVLSETDTDEEGIPDLGSVEQ